MQQERRVLNSYHAHPNYQEPPSEDFMSSVYSKLDNKNKKSIQFKLDKPAVRISCSRARVLFQGKLSKTETLRVLYRKKQSPRDWLILEGKLTTEHSY